MKNERDELQQVPLLRRTRWGLAHRLSTITGFTENRVKDAAIERALTLINEALQGSSIQMLTSASNPLTHLWKKGLARIEIVGAECPHGEVEKLLVKVSAGGDANCNTYSSQIAATAVIDFEGFFRRCQVGIPAIFTISKDLPDFVVPDHYLMLNIVNPFFFEISRQIAFSLSNLATGGGSMNESSSGGDLFHDVKHGQVVPIKIDPIGHQCSSRSDE